MSSCRVRQLECSIGALCKPFVDLSVTISTDQDGVKLGAGWSKQSSHDAATSSLLRRHIGQIAAIACSGSTKSTSFLSSRLCFGSEVPVSVFLLSMVSALKLQREAQSAVSSLLHLGVSSGRRVSVLCSISVKPVIRTCLR